MAHTATFHQLLIPTSLTTNTRNSPTKVNGVEINGANEYSKQQLPQVFPNP